MNSSQDSEIRNPKSEIFINGLGCISPQFTTGGELMNGNLKEHEGNYLKCIDPDYKLFIPPAMARRAGRIIKMGTVAAKMALQDAGVEMPGAIITGTGMGCLEDTENFLTEIIRNEEKMLAPTAFIQSTHNTVASQIAILLNCNNYNMTFVHRGFSFESALLDSILQLQSGEAENILTGGLDEMIPGLFRISQRLGIFREYCNGHLGLTSKPENASVAGEGTAFFLLGSEQTPSSYCRIKGLEMLYKPTEQELSSKMYDFLDKHTVKPGGISLLISGMNGDGRFLKNYEVVHSAFSHDKIAFYKHLCGEYHTSTAFALWLSAMSLKNGSMPSFATFTGKPAGDLKNILIYNNYLGINHTFILLSR